MGKKYYSFLILFLISAIAAQAQHMQRLIHIPAGFSAVSSHQYSGNKSTTSCSIDTILLTSQSQIDNFSSTYPSCTTPKYLIIDGAAASPAINSLSGLSSITQVINKLEIRNTNITSLNALNNITSIGDTLLLERNNALTSLGLANLTGLGAIYFKHLPALTSVAGLCNNFHKTGLIFIDSTGLSNLSGLHTIDSLTTSNGGLEINRSPIVNLAALNNIKYMDGYLKLSNNELQTGIGLTNIKNLWGFLIDGLPLLNSVSGLTNNLANGNIGTFWFFNTGIPSLAGLEGLTGSSNFYISGNNSLSSLNGLQNLSGNIDGGISIWGNSTLSDISALSGITNIDNGTVEVSYNNINTVNGLKNLVSIGKGLWLAGNVNLTNLDSLNTNLVIHNNPDGFSGLKDSVRIYDNTLLAVCANAAVCNYLSGGGPAFIDNNAAGCNTIAEINTACAAIGSYDDTEDNCCINNAIALNENVEKRGNVGRYDQVADDFVDQYDTYRIILSKAGSIKLYAEAKKDSCSAGNLLVELLDKTGNQFPADFYTLVNFNSNPCSTVITDSVRITSLEADTFYLRLQSTNQVRYKIWYQFFDSAMVDVEPNNAAANAVFMNPLETKTGHISFKRLAFTGYDVFDNYKTYVPGGGNLKVYIKSTFRKNSPHFFSTTDYVFTVNNVNSGESRRSIVPFGTTMSYGDVRYDTLQFCAIIGDTVYFKVETGQPFEYEIKYEITSAGLPPNDAEPNNSFATATPIAYNEVKQGLVKAVAYSAAGTIDFDDYYKTFLPKNGKLKVVFTGANISCNNTNTVTLELYGKNGFAFPPIQASYTDGDTLYYCSLISDTAYFRITAFYPFSYSLKYEMTDTTVVNDAEPNNTIATAIPVSKGDTKKGTLSFKNNLFTDVSDMYRMVFTCPDTLKLTSVFTSKSCGVINNFFMGTAIRLYNKSGVLINSKAIPNLAADIPYYDTTSFPINTPDTFYVAYSQIDVGSNVAPLTYEFNIKNTPPSASFIITGADSTCISTKTYKAENVCGNGLTYHWSLSSGGTLTAVDSIATVVWTIPGAHTISLYTSNASGNSAVKQFVVNVIVPLPLTAPAITANGRLLKSIIAPVGVGYQWYKTGVVIAGANDSVYNALDSGTYVVRYKNYCGVSNPSNAIYFALPILSQTITFNPLTPDINYAANAFVIAHATASSNLPVSYSIVTGPGTISLDSVKITGAGTIIIAADQAGDINFYPAATRYDTIQVTPANQTITFNPIPNKKYSDTTFTVSASSSAGLPITYIVVSGNATISGNTVTMTGAGNVSIQATQAGNGNYTAASPVTQSFCIGIRDLGAIQGSAEPCFGTYTYTTKKIAGANYVWTLSSGGVLSFNNDTATVTWTTAGTHTLTVNANSSCDAVYGTLYSLTVSPSNNTPTVVTNMLPVNNAIDQQLPLALSWIPGQFTVNYDLFVWRSDTLQPASPFATNISGVTYTIPNGALPYNKTYKWRLVSKNPCNQTAGPVQQFSLIPLPDLLVQNVQAPLTAFSGQNISINWTVKNIGPGRTNTNQNWTDAVFLSFDTMPVFNVLPDVNPNGWSYLNFPVRPLLIATRSNVSALDSGQQYSNSINYTLPVANSQPVYVYVISNYPSGSSAPLQVTYINDTARAPQPIAITLSPTPDLRVDSVFASNTTFSGSTINVTYKVKNYGVNTPAGSSWTDRFYISNNAVFNSNNAVELKAPKANGTYYFNTPLSQVEKSGVLQADSFYTVSKQLVIPNFLNGTYFIHVVTNTGNTVYEGAAANNNTGNKQIQVIITPTPKLQVNTLNIAADTLSNTQPFNVAYNTINNGFFDNIEKNQGRYAVRGGNACALINAGGGGGGNTTSSSQPVAVTDSLGWGSSGWIDNLYLSTDSTGLNSGNSILLATVPHNDDTHGIAGNDDFKISSCLSTLLGQAATVDLSGLNMNTKLVVTPLANFPVITNSSIPASLPAGKYYIYVWANANKGVFEFPNTNEIKRSQKAIVIKSPDLTVPTISAPAAVYGGQSFTITYTVANNSTSGVFNAVRRDYLYVSNSPVFDNTATLLPNNNNFIENVINGIPVSHSFTYSFPNTTTGIKYFYVRTNGGDLIQENTYTNNVSAAAIVNVSLPPASATCDLLVSSITMADTVFAKLPIQIQYTVPNSGLGTTQATWTDSIFVSCSPVFNAATAKFVALRTQSRTVAGGSSYTDVFDFTTAFANEVNSCFPVQQYNNAYFFVKTNADNTVYEGSNTNNNVLGTGLKVWVNPWPDYIVTAVSTTADTTIVGRPFPASWAVKNLKYDYITNYFSDGIYFSPDSVFNGNAVLANPAYNQQRSLGQNQSYSETFSFTTPNLPTGDYYVIAKTNNYNTIYNEFAGNNTNLTRNGAGAAKKIHLIQLPLPDLTDSITSAPATIAIGQPLTVKASVTNKGPGANYPSSFSNKLWLSTDFIPNNGNDYDLGSDNVSTVINPNQSYTDSITLVLPLSIPAGNYVLIWQVNSSNNVIETITTNNLAFKYITVTHPVPVDLLVSNIAIPDTAYLGYSIDTLKWTILNNAANVANGFSSDGLYLSKNTLLDSTASLLSINQRFLQMQPLQKDTIVKQAIVNNIAEGAYNVLVKADVLNNILETNKNNNVGIAAKKLYVKVIGLPINVLKPDSLSNAVYRYYKLSIPDSLKGSTIQVSLRSADSLSRTNQLYIAAGYVPDPAHFDYKYETPNYGNQDIVMTSVNDSIYYITVRNVNSALKQNITLKAVKLPFTILNVQSNSGGNTGNVTVKITGNLFNAGMVAKLKRNTTIITASTIYFVNSTTIYATFNLAAKPTGIYDVELFKTSDSTYASLLNGFSIVPANNGGLITGGGVNGIPGNGNEPGCDPNAASGLNSQLVVELVVPDKVFVPFPFTFQVNYTNPTNVDIPAQTRVVYVDQSVLMALSQAGLPTGTSSLYLTLTEPGGPPGIIRAGASGTITIYGKAPNNTPGHTFLHFTIK